VRDCPEVEPPQRFPVRFYLVAMIFVIFDIEVVFMYPSPSSFDNSVSSVSSKCWSSP